MKYTILFITGFVLWLSACADNQLLSSSPADVGKIVVEEEKKYIHGGSDFLSIRKSIYHNCYGVTTINGTKPNPCYYGDFLGDWS